MKLTISIRSRAKYFETFGIQAFDADVLLTVDERFVMKANLIEDLTIKIMNPLQWLEGVLK